MSNNSHRHDRQTDSRPRYGIINSNSSPLTHLVWPKIILKFSKKETKEQQCRLTLAAGRRAMVNKRCWSRWETVWTADTCIHRDHTRVNRLLHPTQHTTACIKGSQQTALVLTSKQDKESNKHVHQKKCHLTNKLDACHQKKICACVARANNSSRHQEAWLHRCSWPPLQLTCAAYKLFVTHSMHSNYRQTKRRTDITTELHILSFAFTGNGHKFKKKPGLISSYDIRHI